MSVLLLLLIAAPDDLVATYHAATRAETPCVKAATEDEITVCGRRDADKRYRITFVTSDVRDAVFRERTRLMRNPFPKCGITGPFLVSETCGSVGITASTSGGAVRVKTRPLAP